MREVRGWRLEEVRKSERPKVRKKKSMVDSPWTMANGKQQRYTAMDYRPWTNKLMSQ
jgi:hypothetical protein